MLQLLTYPEPSTQQHPAPRQFSPPASRHYDYPPPGCGGCLTRISRTFYVSCKWTFIFCYEFIIGFNVFYVWIISARLVSLQLSRSRLYYLNSRSERLRCTNTVTNNTGLFIGGGSEEIYTIHLICFIA